MKNPKKLLLLGASKRLGAHLASYLSKDYSLFLQYRQNPNLLEALQKNLGKERITLLKGDFSTKEGVESFCGNIQHQTPELDAILYTIGPYSFDSPLTAKIPVVENLLQLSLYAPLVILQKLTPLLEKTKGSFVSMGMCGLAVRQADIRTFSYTLSKNNLLLLTKSAALELASKNVRVNMVSPGYLFDTEDLPKGKVPAKRLGTYEDIQEAVSFLLDPKNSYITGQNIEVAGGVRL